MNRLDSDEPKHSSGNEQTGENAIDGVGNCCVEDQMDKLDADKLESTCEDGKSEESSLDEV
eukprot:CAMPEP_0113945366 /NCGR_PEP_ID=MMETSP1339-20121228/44740_1 /TAXON_ID=94617 /ORGANISM="Fibrocapsa japonica" /LENGTH=60 /DNA_ID=CAMNT_0000950917 /DNA_START=1 /DNA_END=180 /DNA_ORIENTATION=- /assembly_acc=CAM_ASM_000762